MTQEKLQAIAAQFELVGDVESIKPLGEGFINDTYIVKTAVIVPKRSSERGSN